MPSIINNNSSIRPYRVPLLLLRLKLYIDTIRRAIHHQQQFVHSSVSSAAPTAAEIIYRYSSSCLPSTTTTVRPCRVPRLLRLKLYIDTIRRAFHHQQQFVQSSVSSAAPTAAEIIYRYHSSCLPSSTTIRPFVRVECRAYCG